MERLWTWALPAWAWWGAILGRRPTTRYLLVLSVVMMVLAISLHLTASQPLFAVTLVVFSVVLHGLGKRVGYDAGACDMAVALTRRSRDMDCNHMPTVILTTSGVTALGEGDDQ